MTDDPKKKVPLLRQRRMDDFGFERETDVVDAAEDTSDEEGEEEAAAAAGAHDDLRTYGVAVVRALDAPARAHWEALVWRAMDDFPEYRARGRDVQRVLGGFGALGNPSSFHHPVVRRFRRLCKKTLFRPLMARYARARFGAAAARHVRLETLFDRLCVRCEAFGRPTAEKWHRDIYAGDKYGLRPLPASLPGDADDELFGGWTNLDARPQRFVALLGTHTEATRGAAGFAEFSEAEIKSLRFAERLAAQRSRVYGATLRTDAAGYVLVPPGHSVVFRQQLIHSVVSGPQPETPALRVFHGLRLTRETTSLFDVAAAVENGGVPRIPSGQVPPMYSSNHYAFFQSHARYRDWGGATFRSECLFRRALKAGGGAYHTPGSRDNRNRAANTGRYMPSLAEMGLWDERFRYTEREARAMQPQLLWSAEA